MIGVSATSMTAAIPDDDAPRSLEHGASYVVVRLGDAEFALPIESVRQVLRAPLITRIPTSSPARVGLFALRGVVVPALDLGLLLRRKPADRSGSVVVVRPADSPEPVGLLVDAVTGLADAEQHSLRPAPPEAEASLPQGWVSGIMSLDADRVVTLLDSAVLLSDQNEQTPARSPTGDDNAKETR